MYDLLQQRYNCALKASFPIFTHESLKRKTCLLSFRKSFCLCCLLILIAVAIVCSLECGLKPLVYSDLFFSIDTTLHALCIGITCIRWYELGLKHYRGIVSIADLIAGVGCLFDMCELLVYGHTTRSLTLRSIPLICFLRFLASTPARISDSTGHPITLLFYRMAVETFAITSYSVFFVIILSGIAALIVVPDALSQMNTLRYNSGLAWTAVRKLLGSVVNGTYSMIQVSTMDCWLSQLARPLIEAGLLLPAFSVFLVVICVNCAYKVAVIGCMVDRCMEISHEIYEKEKALRDTKYDIHRTSLLKSLSTIASVEESEIQDPFTSSESFLAHVEKDSNLKRHFRMLDLDANDVIQAFKTMKLPGSESGLSLGLFSEALPRLKVDSRGQDLIHLNSLLNLAHNLTDMVSHESSECLDLAFSCEMRVGDLQSLLASLQSDKRASAESLQKEVTRVRNRHKIMRAFQLMSDDHTEGQKNNFD